MEQRKFSLKRLFKTLFCEHIYHYISSNGYGKKITDYYQCENCWKLIAVEHPDFDGNILEEIEKVKKIIEK